MAGIPLFAQGGHEKLTPQKAARAAQNPAQNPYFSLKNVFALKKNGFGAKKGPPKKNRPCGRKKSVSHTKKAKPLNRSRANRHENRGTPAMMPTKNGFPRVFACFAKQNRQKPARCGVRRLSTLNSDLLVLESENSISFNGARGGAAD